MAHDVFLSYSSKDKFAADAACAVLERAGIRVWMAPRDILPGMEWGASIIAAINTALVMVLVFSGNANESKQVRLEVGRAINKGLPLIPFRIEDVEPGDALELFISSSHWLDAYTKPLEQHLDRLANVVRRVIESKYGEGRPSADEAAAQRAEAERLQREQEDGARRGTEEAERCNAAEVEARRVEEERAGREGASILTPPTRPKPKIGLLAALAVVAVVALGGGWYAFAPSPVPDTRQAEFEAAMLTDTVPALEAFVTKHPTGPFTNTATQRRDELKAAEQPSSAPLEITAVGPAAPPVAASPCGGATLASISSRTPAPLSEQEECALTSRAMFKECETCPQMVVVPAGSFTMGSPAKEESRSDDEGPQHEVRIAKAFAVGKFVVTVDEFKAFVTATGYEAGAFCTAWDGSSWDSLLGQHSWRDPGFKQTGSHPVVCLNRKDALAYVRWLKEKTGRSYRLLSEAEWEYAARGGTTSLYWWGSSISPSQANYGQNNKATVPVFSYAANPFGLYNMFGNVWQWVEDCYHYNYVQAPTDGSAWTTGNCTYRVVRGGSWSVDPGYLRAGGSRTGFFPDSRINSLGFRVIRTLNH